METALRKDVLEETYEDMENLILKITWNFHTRNGGDIDDLIGQANLLFIYAFDKYDENKKAELSTWLWHYINKGLKTYIRKERNHNYISIDDKDRNINPQTFDSFSIIELLDELEQDTLTVIQLFLETPNEIIQSVLDNGKQMKHMRGYMRRRLRNRLKQMGWTIRRISEAFEKIKEAIQY